MKQNVSNILASRIEFMQMTGDSSLTENEVVKMAVIGEVAGMVSSVIWSNTFWFPGNLTWEDVRNKPEGPHAHIYHPEFKDLLIPIPMAVLLLCLRSLIER